MAKNIKNTTHMQDVTEKKTFIVGSIELSKLLAYLRENPEKAVKTESGKVFVNILVSPRREPDAYNNDISISLSKTEDERKANVATVYIGSGQTKTWEPSSTAADSSTINNLIDDLPF